MYTQIFIGAQWDSYKNIMRLLWDLKAISRESHRDLRKFSKRENSKSTGRTKSPNIKDSSDSLNFKIVNEIIPRNLEIIIIRFLFKNLFSKKND